MTETRSGDSYAVVAALVCLVRHVLFPTREDHATSSLIS